MRTMLCAAAILAMIAQCANGDLATAAPTAINYPVFGFDAARTSINASERTLGPGNVSRLVRQWQIQTPEPLDSTAIELADVPGRQARGTLFVTTLRGTTMSVDQSTGRVLWTFRAQTSSLPDYRITNASPAADPSGQWVYAASPDGKVHKLSSSTGHEAQGWPVTVSLHPQDEKIGSALNMFGTTLLVATGGYIGDFGHYQGRLIAINTRTASMHVFNAMCSNVQALLSEAPSGAHFCTDIRSAVWARGGGVVDTMSGSPTLNSIYIVTGNGTFNGTTDWGDSVVRLQLTATGFRVGDSYTPSNQQALNDQDGDLGSTSPILFPKQSGPHPWLALQGGKDNRLRLFDRANMSGRGAPGHLGGELLSIPMPLGGDMFSSGIALAESRLGTLVYVANGQGIAALRLTLPAGRPRLSTLWSYRGQTTTPLVANGVLYVAGSNLLQAMDPRTGKVLWRSDAGTAHGTIGSVHWQSPTVVNGMVIMPDGDRRLTAYALG